MTTTIRSVSMATLAMVIGIGAVGARAADTQTIVLVRHGEKPDNGLGQLDCRGLNRALKLPWVVQTLFGKPSAVFAPDPSKRKPDHIFSYDYVRPLATVEPTAIAFGLPVNTQFGYADGKALVTEIERPRYSDEVLLVGWEHVELVKIARALLADNGGDPAQVPAWRYSDYDGIYVVRIIRDRDGRHATFEIRQQNLEGQPNQCPGAPVK